MKNIFFYILFCLIISVQVDAQHLLKADGKIISNENGDTVLLRGMGLGGWMVQEGYMLQTASFANPQHRIRAEIEALIGTVDTDLFYEAWLANHCREADIDSLKAWGFNSVRLPMHYNLYTLPIEDEPIAGQQTWLTKGFELTDSLISWCAARQMYVILDLHAAPGGQGYDEAISDYDPTKPSLWESPANQVKMASLWKRIAERYKDEQWVAGYDLLNEPNWNLPGGVALRNLYEDVTDSIRSVDTTHILFIEGNWFANDFTGLTPPWDDNMVYSPHKYWSVNDQASIQWVLNLRDQYNVPLYLGETGENSNVWFRDAVKLYEDNNMGWAWWPMKKVESVAGPLSITKSADYSTLLNYWENGGTQPTANFAKATLMQLTEDLKVENCRYQKDVIDALFRQVYSDETVPYADNNIPGVIYATDYDMGRLGIAYKDDDYGNYSVSTGNYTAWNNGWQYRNDGVDIESSNDNTNSNGYMVGFINTDEWMEYTVDVAADAVYDVNVRVASGTTLGNFYLQMDGADITFPYYAPNTGGWNTWQTITIEDVILSTTDKKLRVVAGKDGFNLGSFEFVQVGTSTSVNTEFVAAETVDPNTVKMSVNKKVDPNTITAAPANFTIYADNVSIPITNITIDTDNPRIIYFTVNHTMRNYEELEISYSGSQVIATDGTALGTFLFKDIRNTLSTFHPIPGKIEAENFFFQDGVQLETTTDAGGGQNIGYLDVNDYLDYEVDVATAGTYKVEFRIASEQTGGLALQVLDASGNATTLQTTTFAATGGWQNWTTYDANVTLDAGQQILRVLVTQASFNMNWMDFYFLTATKEPKLLENIQIFPNPNIGQITVRANIEQAQDVQIDIYNLLGQPIYNQSVNDVSQLNETVNISEFPNGYYMLFIRLEDGTFYSEKILKMD
ncbi:MAG: carbohydrate-binding protein [Saprospiraceae bacterium]